MAVKGHLELVLTAWGPSWGDHVPTWGYLGSVLELSCSVLGPSWVFWNHVGSILGRHWPTGCHLEPVLSHLKVVLGLFGAVLKPSWGRLGPILGRLATV